MRNILLIAKREYLEQIRGRLPVFHGSGALADCRDGWLERHE